MLDDITQAVLAREDVARYLRGGHGQTELAGARAHPRVSRRAADDAAVSDLPRAQASALSDPAQDRAHRRARRDRAATRRAPAASIYISNHKSHLDYLVEPLVLDDNGIRPPVIAAGHQSVRRPARPDSPARHRRDPDPPQHQGPGLPRHAEGVRRRAAAAARPALLHRGRAQLQRRAEGAEDRAAARRAAGRTQRRSSIVPMAVAYDLVLEDHILAHQAAKRRQRPFAREVAEMVRYAVGYQSRAFVTFGAADPARRLRRRSRGAT